MFYITQDNKRVIDSDRQTVGFITNSGRFTQVGCDEVYKSGLSSVELEQISELLQSRKISTFLWNK
jgi:hypothetical protein